MDKEIVREVIARSNSLCEVCGNLGSELHHVIKGNGKRKQHERAESIVLLCMDCHRGTNGIHGKNGSELDLKLKRKLQDDYYNQGYSEDEVRSLMGGKIY